MHPFRFICLLAVSFVGFFLDGCAFNKSGVTGGVPVIDTHIHLYDTARKGGVPWPPTDDQVLYRPILPQHFDKVTKANGVTATVIVEASDQVEDNQWVLDITAHNPKHYVGMVGNLPVGTPEFAKHLERFANVDPARETICPHFCPHSFTP